MTGEGGGGREGGIKRREGERKCVCMYVHVCTCVYVCMYVYAVEAGALQRTISAASESDT